MSGVLQTKIGGITVPPVPLPSNLIIPKINNNALPSGFVSGSDKSQPTGAASSGAVNTTNTYSYAYSGVGSAGDHTGSAKFRQSDATSNTEGGSTYNASTTFYSANDSTGSHTHSWMYKVYNSTSYREFNSMRPDGTNAFKLPQDACFFVTNLTDYNKFNSDARFAEYDGTQDGRGAWTGGVYMRNATTDYSGNNGTTSGPTKTDTAGCNVSHNHASFFGRGRYYSTVSSGNMTLHIWKVSSGGGNVAPGGCNCGGQYHTGDYHGSSSASISSSDYKKFDTIMFIVLPASGVNVESGMSFLLNDSSVPTGYTRLSAFDNAALYLRTDSNTSNIGTAYGNNNVSINYNHNAGSYAWNHHHGQHTTSGCTVNLLKPDMYLDSLVGTYVIDGSHAAEDHPHDHGANSGTTGAGPKLKNSVNLYMVRKD